MYDDKLTRVDRPLWKLAFLSALTGTASHGTFENGVAVSDGSFVKMAIEIANDAVRMLHPDDPTLPR